MKLDSALFLSRDPRLDRAPDPKRMSKPRTTEPVRNQGRILFELPDDAIPPEHQARVLWSVLWRMDLSAFLADALAFEGGSGRSTMSPRMLLTLWTYAISRGVGSAREIRSAARHRCTTSSRRPRSCSRESPRRARRSRR